MRILALTLTAWAAACSPSAGQSDNASTIAPCEDTRLTDDEQIANCSALIDFCERNSTSNAVNRFARSQQWRDVAEVCLWILSVDAGRGSPLASRWLGAQLTQNVADLMPH